MLLLFWSPRPSLAPPSLRCFIPFFLPSTVPLRPTASLLLVPNLHCIYVPSAPPPAAASPLSSFARLSTPSGPPRASLKRSPSPPSLPITARPSASLPTLFGAARAAYRRALGAALIAGPTSERPV